MHELGIDMKNVTFYIALTVGGVTWFFIVWALVVVANRSNAPEPSTDEDVKRAVVLAISFAGSYLGVAFAWTLGRVWAAASDAHRS